MFTTMSIMLHLHCRGRCCCVVNIVSAVIIVVPIAIVVTNTMIVIRSHFGSSSSSAILARAIVAQALSCGSLLLFVFGREFHLCL